MNANKQDAMTIISTVKNALSEIGYPAKAIKTSQVRVLSAALFKQLEIQDIDSTLSVCETLLKQRDWACSIIAYDWAFKMKKQYTPETFTTFQHWLFTYVTDWNDCDDFCTHAFGELLLKYKSLFPKILPWVNHDNFAVRRATAVILIYPMNKKDYSDLFPLTVANLLQNDEHYLVQKGYGWMLKVLSKHEPETVIKYLTQHRSAMTRTAFRYALEKLDKTTQQKLMAL
ncbi:DNA alkylation repair protein [Photobacterium sp. GB-1]|uniref:DNA alkylation repair protein n=1 Tax=Photobacterium sp. GB-1 TaxID=2022111 RepID=UPI00272BA448|nr:DNA alkylation repair protein [Photobacterium sp. GB-1]